MVNQLLALAQRSARESFWSSFASWPDDTPDHEFLGRFLLRYAKSMYGDGWSDSDPAVHIPEPLSPELNLSTPMPEIRRASSLLIEQVEAYRDRSRGGLFGPGPDFPSRAEWMLAREAIDAQIDVAKLKYWRFLKVSIALHDAFKSEKIKTAVRGQWGGEIIGQHWHFWNMEYAHGRFETCRVKADDPFWLPAVETGNWLFVERQHGTVEPQIDSSLVSEERVAAAEKRRPPRARGRKKISSWDAIFAAFARILHDEGIPEDANLSELARRLADTVTEQGIDDVPATKTIQEKVRIWLSSVRNST